MNRSTAICSAAPTGHAASGEDNQSGSRQSLPRPRRLPRELRLETCPGHRRRSTLRGILVDYLSQHALKVTGLSGSRDLQRI